MYLKKTLDYIRRPTTPPRIFSSSNPPPPRSFSSSNLPPPRIFVFFTSLGTPPSFFYLKYTPVVLSSLPLRVPPSYIFTLKIPPPPFFYLNYPPPRIFVFFTSSGTPPTFLPSRTPPSPYFFPQVPPPPVFFSQIPPPYFSLK